MRQCWLSEPMERPLFSECKMVMREELQKASPPVRGILIFLFFLFIIQILEEVFRVKLNEIFAA